MKITTTKNTEFIFQTIINVLKTLTSVLISLLILSLSLRVLFQFKPLQKVRNFFL